jgi:hypothetical protein
VKPQAKPYRIAEICYNPAWPENPWYITRSGTIAGQGGLTLGTERVSFVTIEEACQYLAKIIVTDMEVITGQVEKREQNG